MPRAVSSGSSFARDPPPLERGRVFCRKPPMGIGSEPCNFEKIRPRPCRGDHPAGFAEGAPMPSRLRMVAARARQGNSGGEQAAGAVEPGAKDRNAGRMDHSNVI